MSTTEGHKLDQTIVEHSPKCVSIIQKAQYVKLEPSLEKSVLFLGCEQLFTPPVASRVPTQCWRRTMDGDARIALGVLFFSKQLLF